LNAPIASRETQWRRWFEMPLYEFKCRACGHRFDELVKLNETASCPKCGVPGSERLFSASAGVSTDRSRKRAAGVARRAAGKIKREKDHAQAVYERNYRKEHSEGG
jgi:putative FmdB family regulatory protein